MPESETSSATWSSSTTLPHVQFDHAIDQRRHFVEAVAGNQHGGVFQALGQQVEENLARFRVKVGGRFVHHQDVGVAAQGNGDQQFLLHAAGELDERQVRHLARSRPRRCAISSMRCRSLLHSEAEKSTNWPTGIFSGGGSCGTKPIFAEHLGAFARGRQSIDGHFAIVGVFTEQAADQGGFAGAVGADQGNPLAELDFEVDIIEDLVALECF